jgi:hypothetical protein
MMSQNYFNHDFYISINPFYNTYLIKKYYFQFWEHKLKINFS